MHSFKTLPNRIYTVHMVSLFGEPAFPERLKKNHFEIEVYDAQVTDQ